MDLQERINEAMLLLADIMMDMRGTEAAYVLVANAHELLNEAKRQL